MSRRAAILFDLGGVLLPFDRERRIAAIVARTGCTPENARAFMALDLHRRLDTGEADEHELASACSDFFGVALGAGEATALMLSVFEPPNAALWSLADRLRARAVVGGFSDNPTFVERMFPPGARLEPMLFSSQIGACKPSDAAFAAAEASLGVAVGDILFIDDGPANVEAAIRRGWDAVRFVTNEALAAELAARGLA